MTVITMTDLRRTGLRTSLITETGGKFGITNKVGWKDENGYNKD